MRYVLPCVALLGLAACASPQQRCITRATEDLRTVNSLIAETEATIERGYDYRVEDRPVSVGVGFCTYTYSYLGLCANNRRDTVRRPVAVNLNEERATLESLRDKRTELRNRASVAVAQCQADFPEPSPG